MQDRNSAREDIEARAQHPDPDVRAALAAAEIVAESFAAMRMLASDPDPEVREVFIANPVVPAAYSQPAFRGHPALLPERAMAPARLRRH